MTKKHLYTQIAILEQADMIHDNSYNGYALEQVKQKRSFLCHLLNNYPFNDIPFL